MTLTRQLRVAGLVSAALLLSVPLVAYAHHSFSAYAMDKSASVNGTLKEFRWGAPHSSLVIIYTDAKGKPAPMMLASAAPAAFSKQGFKPSDFHPGDKLVITYHPNRSGAPGGALASLKTADGRAFSDGEALKAETKPKP